MLGLCSENVMKKIVAKRLRDLRPLVGTSRVTNFIRSCDESARGNTQQQYINEYQGYNHQFQY